MSLTDKSYGLKVSFLLPQISVYIVSESRSIKTLQNIGKVDMDE